MLVQDVQPLELLEKGHYVLLIGSGPVPMLLDALQSQFTLGLPLDNLQTCWSVLEHPLFCMMILGILLWVNRQLQNVWQTDPQLDGDKEQHVPLCELVEVV